MQGSGNFRLIVRRGPQPNQIHEMNKDVLTIGRDITNDITINDPEVSRHHARLTRGGAGYTIEDLGSTNGTFVNGQRLTGARPLSPGDMIGLGETVTLAFEALGFNNPMATAPAMSGGMGLPGAPAPEPMRPASQPSPYGPPPPQAAPNPYAPPPQPGMSPQVPMYPDQTSMPPYVPQGGYEPEPARGGMARWLLLGCGCFIVLCVIGAVVALIVIDSTCAWQQEPLSSILDVFNLAADSSSSACQ